MDLQARVGKMESQLKEWGGKLEELASKAKDVAKADYHKLLDDAHAKHRAAQAKLEELKEAGSDKWESLKSGAEKAWAEVEAAFKKLAN